MSTVVVPPEDASETVLTWQEIIDAETVFGTSASLMTNGGTRFNTTFLPLESGRVFAFEADAATVQVELSSDSDLTLSGIYTSGGERLELTLTEVGDLVTATFSNPTHQTLYMVVPEADDPARVSPIMATLQVTQPESILDSDPNGPIGTTTIDVGEFHLARIDYEGDFDWFKIHLEDGKIYQSVQTGVGGPLGLATPQQDYLIYETNLQPDNNSSTQYFTGERLISVEQTGWYYVRAGGYGSETGFYSISVEEVTDTVGDDYASATGLTLGETTHATAETQGDRDVFFVDLVAGAQYTLDFNVGAESEFPFWAPDLLEVSHESGLSLDIGEAFTAPLTGRYYVTVGNGRHSYDLTVSQHTPDHGSTFETATEISVGTEVTFQSFPGEVDVFEISATAGQVLQIVGDDGGTAEFELYNAAGDEITSQGFFGSPTWSFYSARILQYNIEEDGTYFVVAEPGHIADLRDLDPFLERSFTVTDISDAPEYQVAGVELDLFETYTFTASVGEVPQYLTYDFGDPGAFRVEISYEIDDGAIARLYGKSSGDIFRDSFGASRDYLYVANVGDDGKLHIATSVDGAENAEATVSVQVTPYARWHQFESAEEFDSAIPLALDETKSVSVEYGETTAIVATLEKDKVYELQTGEANTIGVSRTGYSAETYASILTFTREGDNTFFQPEEDGSYVIFLTATEEGTDTATVSLTQIDPNDVGGYNDPDIPTLALGDTYEGMIWDDYHDQDYFNIQLDRDHRYEIVVESLNDLRVDAELRSGDLSRWETLPIISVEEDSVAQVVVEGATGAEYRLIVKELHDDIGQNPETAQVFDPEGSNDGELDSNRDTDWWTVQLEAGETYRIEAEIDGVPQRDIWVRRIWDEFGNPLDLETTDTFVDLMSGVAYIESGIDQTIQVAVTADGFSGGFEDGEKDYTLVVEADVSHEDAQPYFADLIEVGNTYSVDYDDLFGTVNFMARLDPDTLYRADVSNIVWADISDFETAGDPEAAENRIWAEENASYAPYVRLFGNNDQGQLRETSDLLGGLSSDPDKEFTSWFFQGQEGVSFLGARVSRLKNDENDWTSTVESFDLTLTEVGPANAEAEVHLELGTPFEGSFSSPAEHVLFTADLDTYTEYRITVTTAEGAPLEYDVSRSYEHSYWNDYSYRGDGQSHETFLRSGAAGTYGFVVNDETVFSQDETPGTDYIITIDEWAESSTVDTPLELALDEVTEFDITGRNWFSVDLEAGNTYLLAGDGSRTWLTWDNAILPNGQTLVPGNENQYNDRATATHDVRTLDLTDFATGSSSGSGDSVSAPNPDPVWENAISILAPVDGTYLFQADVGNDFTTSRVIATEIDPDMLPNAVSELEMRTAKQGTLGVDEGEYFSLRTASETAYELTLSTSGEAPLSLRHYDPLDLAGDGGELVLETDDRGSAILVGQGREDLFFSVSGPQEAPQDYEVFAREMDALLMSDQQRWLTIDDQTIADNEVIVGTDLIDMVAFDREEGGITAALNLGWVKGRGGEDFVLDLVDVEGVTGTSASDQFVMSAGFKARGLGSSDTFVFKSEDDVAGTLINGGGGRDRVNFVQLDTGVHVDMERGRFYAGDENGRIRSVERVIATDHDDRLYGDDKNNLLVGGRGDDTFVGNGGRDVIKGSHGTDTVIYAGAMADYQIETSGIRTTVTDLVGNDGTDVLAHIELLQFADGEVIL